MTLSPRQYAVARLISRGYTQAEIAELLGISRRTVEHHATAIRLKAGEPTTRRAASRAHARDAGAGARVANGAD